MDKITQDFSRTLKRLRTEKNLTQEELAQRSGVDYKYFQKLEGHTPSSPTLSTLDKLSKGLGISLVEFIVNIDADHKKGNSTPWVLSGRLESYKWFLGNST